MKKLLLILILSPLVSFGQTVEQNNSRTSSDYNSSGNDKFDSGDWVGALVEYNKAIELDPNNAYAYFGRAVVLGDDKPNEKLASYNKYIELITTNDWFEENLTNAFVSRSNVKILLGDFIGAIKDSSKAIERWSYNEWAYYYRGLAKSKLKDYPGAIIDYTSSIEIKPDFIDAYVNRGDAKIVTLNYKGAIEDFTKVIELGLAIVDPGYDVYRKIKESYNQRGIAKIEIGDIEGACDDYLEVFNRGGEADKTYIDSMPCSDNGKKNI